MPKSLSTEHALYQLCTYSVADKPEHQLYGLAKMRHGFSMSDVEFIVDAVTGERITPWKMYNYELLTGPLAYLATSIQEAAR